MGGELSLQGLDSPATALRRDLQENLNMNMNMGFNFWTLISKDESNVESLKAFIPWYLCSHNLRGNASHDISTISSAILHPGYNVSLSASS